MNKINTEGKIALVSGANRGIGKEITIALLEKGAAKVYAGARDINSLSSLKETYGDRLVPLALDVTKEESIAKAAEQVKDLDILVNNAGVFSLGPVLGSTAVSSLQQNLDVNVWGVIKLSNALLEPLNKSTSSAIVNISSVAGLGNMPMCATYSVSKAAVHSITQGMRAELAQQNTLVMGVYPGPIATDMAAAIEMEKETPQNVAKAIINGLENGNEDVYPDPMSSEIASFYASNPKGVEQQFANFI